MSTKLPFLGLLGLVGAAACGSSAPAPAAPAPAPVATANALHIGSLEAWSLLDGTISVPADGKTFGVGLPSAEVGDLLVANGLPRDRIDLSIQTLVVKANGKVVMFDTGAARVPFAKAGLVGSSLAQAKLSPGDVTDIFITHAHADHVFGLVTDGALTFPAATVHMSAPEWAALQKEAEADADAKSIASVIAPKVVAFEPGAQVLPEVKAVATPGHTVGHSSYEVSDGAEKLFVLGDLAHHSIISVQRPSWNVEFDGGKADANAMRATTLESLMASGTRVFAGHFPFPGIGTFVRQGDHLAWTPQADAR